MTGRIFISADDLTGALDTGVQFAKAGLHVRVTPTPAFISGDEDVLVVCTQTRHLPAQKARAVVRDVFTQAKQAGSYGVYFKKLDSTLRGNVGSELEGMADALGADCIRLCNAFPAAGRTTKNGIQYVNGTALHETPFAKDPFNPIFSSSIEEIIRAQSPGAAAITRVLDAQTDEEIDQHMQEEPSVLAGCAGLAGALARKRSRTNPPAFPAFASPPLILLGSINPVADEQAAYAAGQGVPLFTLPECPSSLPAIVQTPRPSAPVSSGDGRAMAQRMGALFAQRMRTSPDTPVMVVGGDSLLACIEAVRCEELVPLGEVLPGTVLLRMTFDGHFCHLLSRAGGFGGRSALVDTIEYLNGGIAL